MLDIKVTYDGEYPCACSGRLTIYEDDKIIYSKEHCCESTGDCRWDRETEEMITTDGKLKWNDAKEFNKDIRKAVRNVLSKINVCCGGCE